MLNVMIRKNEFFIQMNENRKNMNYISISLMKDRPLCGRMKHASV